MWEYGGTVTITPTLARLCIHDRGVSFGPSMSWPSAWSVILLPLFLLSRTVPSWQFAWSDITRVENTGNGVRFILRDSEEPIIFTRWDVRLVLDVLESRGVPVDRQVKPAGWLRL